jgi:hypothetical protein
MWPLLLLLVVAAALLYLAFLHSKLAKEVKEVKEVAQACMTVEEWEEEVQPQIEALQREQTGARRQIGMLSVSVRALEQTKKTARQADEEGDLPQFAEDTDLHATAAGHTEDQIQAMLSSVANMLGMPRPEEAGFQPFAGAQLFVASPPRPTMRPVIEDVEEDVEELGASDAEEG